MFLNAQQLYDLTKKRRKDAQVRALRRMGIEHRVRPDGSAAVLEDHVNKLLGGMDENSVNRQRAEPNWPAL